MTRVLCVVPLLLLISSPASASSPAASSDPKSLVIPAQELSKARELVQQLGSEQFQEREQAERDLEKMGRVARAALLEGVNNDPSPEVRSRCHTLLPRATSLEMKARLDVFLADTEGKHDHDLPGWNEFRSLTRDEWSIFGYPLWADSSLDKPARKIFAELLSTPINRQLVMATGGPESELGALAGARRQELYNQKYGRIIVGGGVVSRPTIRREPTVEDIAALLFAESQAPAKAAAARTVSISVLLNSSGFLAAIKNPDEKGKVYQAVAAAWLDTRQDPIEMYNALTIASNQLVLPEQSCRLAIRLLDAKGAQVFYRGQAAATLVKFGNKGHIASLEKAIADNSVLTTLQRNVFKDGKNELVRTEIQIRDVALAAAIILAGEKPEDFGFQDQFKNNGNPNLSFSYTRYLLDDDDARKATFAKWKAWREKNP
jgi:hypothetical protein